MKPLPPTSPDLNLDSTVPYFLWWTEATVGDLRRLLRSDDPAVRGYWLGALLREANSRDVWLYTSANELREMWPHLARHLGRAREMWAWLLDVADTPWPPPEATRG